MNQIYVFTGDNTYALREEILRWTAEFRSKYGEENLSRLDGRRMDLSALLDEIAVAPFIAEKRLVIVDELPNFEKEDIARLKDEIHPQALLLFNAPKIDKRLSSTKAFLKEATVKEFHNLSPQAINQWIDACLKQEGCSMTPAARSLLLDLVGFDQEFLSMELKKLCMYKMQGTIDEQDIEEMVVSSGERAVWHLLDLLGARKVEEAVSYSEKLLRSGESAHSLWNRLLWMVESFGAVWSMVSEGERNPATIAKEMGLPFPTVRGLVPLCQKMDFETVSRIINEMSQSDTDLKTGVYKATVEGAEELEALIDRSLLRFR